MKFCCLDLENTVLPEWISIITNHTTPFKFDISKSLFLLKNIVQALQISVIPFEFSALKTIVSSSILSFEHTRLTGQSWTEIGKKSMDLIKTSISEIPRNWIKGFVNNQTQSCLLWISAQRYKSGLQEVLVS